jgi:hypothetical protein
MPGRRPSLDGHFPPHRTPNPLNRSAADPAQGEQRDQLEDAHLTPHRKDQDAGENDGDQQGDQKYLLFLEAHLGEPLSRLGLNASGRRRRPGGQSASSVGGPTDFRMECTKPRHRAKAPEGHFPAW